MQTKFGASQAVKNQFSPVVRAALMGVPMLKVLGVTSSNAHGYPLARGTEANRA
jgi:hypothetical protein